MGEVLLTIAVGAVCGYILFRLKFPSGFIVGAIIGVAVLSIGFEAASFPVWARTLAQITAGAFIGCSVDKESLRGLRRILRPLALLLGFYLVLNLLVGFLFVRITSMDLMTCLMCSVPGGMTDIPIIAADMGANVPYVAVLQFARMVTGVGIFPLVIARFARQDGLLAEGRRDPAPAAPSPEAPAAPPPAKTPARAQEVLLTMVVGILFGVLGKALGIPAGTILFSTVSVLVLKLTTGKGCIPRWLKRVAQVLTGCYVGSCFGRQELLQLKYLLVPALVLIAGYALNCFLMGRLLPRLTHLTRVEAMLISTPAGASDMALISSDMGVDNPEVSFIQILRMILVVTVFPHIINLTVWLAGG